MFRLKKVRGSVRPFDEMLQAIVKSYRRQWWLGPSFIIGSILGTITWVVTPEMADLPGRASIALLVFLSAATATFIILLLCELLNWLDVEAQRVENAISILNGRAYSDEQLDVMQERAQVSNGLLPLQTTLPLLILPLLISLVSRHGLSLTMWLFVVLGVEFFTLGLLAVIDRANTSGVLLHTLAEYRAEQKSLSSPSSSSVLNGQDNPFSSAKTNILVQPSPTEEITPASSASPLGATLIQDT